MVVEFYGIVYLYNPPDSKKLRIATKEGAQGAAPDTGGDQTGSAETGGNDETGEQPAPQPVGSGAEE